MNPSSENRLLNQQALCTTLDKAMYSTSIDNKAVIDCFLENQVIDQLAIMKTYPEVDFWSSVLVKARDQQGYGYP